MAIFKIKLRDESEYCVSDKVFGKQVSDDVFEKAYRLCVDSYSCTPNPHPSIGSDGITQRNVSEVNRITVVEWLYQLIDDPPLFCLTVHLLDFLLARIPVRKGVHFQLLASTCYVITCKYHDVSIPDIDFIIRSTDYSFTAQCVVQEERRVLAAVDYMLPLLTTRVYFLSFLWQCLQSSDREQVMSQYMLDIVSTYSYQCNSLRMSTVVCAIMHYVRQLVPPFVFNHTATLPSPAHFVPAATNTIWPPYMEDITGISEEQLVPAVQLVRGIHFQYVSEFSCKVGCIQERYDCREKHFASSLLVPLPDNSSLHFDFLRRPRHRSRSHSHSQHQSRAVVSSPAFEPEAESVPSGVSDMAANTRNRMIPRSVSTDMGPLQAQAQVTVAGGGGGANAKTELAKCGPGKRTAAEAGHDEQPPGKHSLNAATVTAAVVDVDVTVDVTVVPNPVDVTVVPNPRTKGCIGFGQRSLSLNSVNTGGAARPPVGSGPGGLRRSASVSQGLISAYYPAEGHPAPAPAPAPAPGVIAPYQDNSCVGAVGTGPGKMQTNARLNRIRNQISGVQQTASLTAGSGLLL